MAETSFFRRRNKNDLVLASAMKVDLSSKKAVKAILNYRQDWQKQAIEDTRAIGELQYGVAMLAALVSRITMFAAKNPEELDSEPVRLKGSNPEEKLVIDTIDRLGSTLSRADLQHDLAYNLLVTGECYLICIAERGNIPERWEIRSITEVESEGKTIKTYDFITGAKVVLDKPDDTFIRIWRPDPFQHELATSHLRAILGAAEELLWWDASAQAVAKSRLAMAGLIGIPTNFDIIPEDEDDAKLSGSQRWANRFTKNAVEAIQNPTDAASAVPLVYTYPTNDRGKSGIDVTEFERPQDDLLEARTDRSLRRVEQGINLPYGVISGLGSATHWGAGQIEESLFREHIEPIVILMVSALTRSYLLPIITHDDNASVITEPSKYFIWYDASNLVIHQDRSANALRALELGGIGWVALRRELGFSETDKPSDEERQEIADWLKSIKGGGGPLNANQGQIPNPSNITTTPESPTKPPQPVAPGKRASEQRHAGPMKGKGQKVAASAVQHSDLIVKQVQMLCDERCRRALEIAGNRIKNRAAKVPAYKSTLRNIPPIQAAAHLGREAVTQLGMTDLFDGSFEELHGRLCAVLPVEYMALDTITPINELIKLLRVKCYEALFTPPSKGFIVEPSLVVTFLDACTTLAIEPETA